MREKLLHCIKFQQNFWTFPQIFYLVGGAEFLNWLGGQQSFEQRHHHSGAHEIGLDAATKHISVLSALRMQLADLFDRRRECCSGACPRQTKLHQQNSLEHSQGAVLLDSLGQLDGRAVCQRRVGQTEALQVCVAAQRLEQLCELLIGNVLRIQTKLIIMICTFCWLKI